MADLSHATDGPSPLSREGYDESLLPDFDRTFVSDEDLAAFERALSAPEASPSTDDLPGTNTGTNSAGSRASFDSTRTGNWGVVERRSFDSRRPGEERGMFITAQSDWAPVNRKVRGRKRRRRTRRSRDETREGYLYSILKWPLLAIVGAWICGLGLSYTFTRLYIFLYEHFIAWRGKREGLRRKLQATTNYGDWVKAAKELDKFLGNEEWKSVDEYAYYDHKTVRRVLEQIRKYRRRAEEEEKRGAGAKSIEELKALVEACVKNNFVGVENSRLYSQTYYGTKHLVQEFIDEGTYLSPVSGLQD
jgi:hypothetical protein